MDVKGDGAAAAGNAAIPANNTRVGNGGTAASSSNPFSIPRSVRIANKYVVLEKIGSGAFGDIYSGTSPQPLNVPHVANTTFDR